MGELEEDLTTFDLDALIALANKITKKMEENGTTKADAEKLRRVSVEFMSSVLDFLTGCRLLVTNPCRVTKWTIRIKVEAPVVYCAIDSLLTFNHCSSAHN